MTSAQVIPTRRGVAYLYDHKPALADMRDEVLAGLRARPRRISPKYFYDARGSRLFQAITELPEYYPTRTEIRLLRRHGVAIRECVGDSCLLVEFGSGTNAKIRLLLETVRPAAYMPLDISLDQLSRAAAELAEDYPWLEVHAACLDYSHAVTLPEIAAAGRRVAFFPGSSIGNFEPATAVTFLARVRQLVAPAGGLLLGVDLVKDPGVLEAAYNDVQGVTAAFNRNLLHHVRRRLGATVAPGQFGHVAVYNATRQRIEMYLESLADQVVSIGGERFAFRRGERIHTENSYKYHAEQIAGLAAGAGFSVSHSWLDERGYFGLFYLRPCAASVPDF